MQHMADLVTSLQDKQTLQKAPMVDITLMTGACCLKFVQYC